MDLNGNQRKRAGRMAKSTSGNEKSPTQNVEHNEVMEVSAVAISPTLEESPSTTNAPECRRSSRKKIIKFDVRDLLNKNRKTHKIQIEARIDSNAPTTSKSVAAGGIETANTKTSSTQEDLLSKQKTFLEKSAIFRRYSISQEHKPPPPLPIPPLLGKANDNKDVGHPSSSTVRRLNRAQEFFSNALIKPKQPTSLIVAQIESNAPCSVATTKRKTVETTEMAYPSVVQQKKRGRPAKIKIPNIAETHPQEESTKKKMTPEKAKNWKEYKACLAQQQQSSTSKKEESRNIKVKGPLFSSQQAYQAQNLFKKQETNKIVVDTLQSDILRSDDDGNFAGFQTNKDDISSDAPLLAKISLEEDNCVKKTLNENINLETKIADNLETKEKELNIKSKLIKEDRVSKQSPPQMVLSEEVDKQQILSTNAQNISFEEISESNLKILKTAKIETKNNDKMLEDIQNTTSIIDQSILKPVKDDGRIISKKEINISTDIPKNKEIEIIKRSHLDTVEKSTSNQNTTACKDVHEKVDFSTNKRPLDNQNIMFVDKDMQRTPASIGEIEIKEIKLLLPELQNEVVQTTFDFTKQHEKESIETKCAETSVKSPQIENEIKQPDMFLKSNHSASETTSPTDLTTRETQILTKQVRQIPATCSKITKILSCTSSSSESENNSEHSSYSSEPFSTTSSSSPRSYKSGDKLRVSIKRISLPKSPSTSSQTSTSEELNDLNIVKRKPPVMAKRSKRLQKKFIETLENENVTKNIYDCLQRTPDVDNKAKHNLEEQINKKNITLLTEETTKIGASFSKKNIKHKSSESELMKSTQEISQDSDEIIVCDTTDSTSNESSNLENFSAKEKNVQRKSLRNRNNKTCSAKYEFEKQKSSEKEFEFLPNESSKHTKLIGTDKYDELEIHRSDETVDNKKVQKSTRTVSPKQNTEKQLEKESSPAKEQNEAIEILIPSEEAMHEIENLAAEVVKNKEKDIIKLSSEDNLSITNKILTVEQANESCDSISDKNKDKEEELFTTDTNTLRDVTGDVEVKVTNPKVVSRYSAEEHKTLEHVVNKTPEKVETNEELIYEIASTNSEGNTEDILKNELNTCLDEREKETSMKINSQKKECSDDKIEIPSEKSETVLTENKINTEPLAITVLKYQTKKPDDKIKEIVSTKDFTASSASESAQVKEFDATTSTQDQMKIPFEKFVTTDKVLASATNKILDDIQEQKSVAKEIILKECSAKSKKEIMQDKTLDTTKDKTKTSGKKAATIDNKIFTKCESDKKDISTAESITLRECSAHSSKQDQIGARKIDAFITKEDLNLTVKESGEAELSSDNEDYLVKSRHFVENKSIEKLLHLEEQKPQSSVGVKSTLCYKSNTSSEENLAIKNMTELISKEKTSPTIDVKKYLSKSTKLPASSNENSENCATESISKNLLTEQAVADSLGYINLSVENTTNSQALAIQAISSATAQSFGKISSNEYSPTSPSTKTISGYRAELSIPLQESNVTIESRARDELTVKCTDTEQEHILHKEKEQILITKAEVANKRPGRKSRFRNLYGPEFDLETEINKEKNIPVPEETVQPQKIYTNITTIGDVKVKEIEKTPELLESQHTTATKQQLDEANISSQEQAETSLLSSQIKNVSIETNTLLDILRTVQSNTEAALKANKPPANVDLVANEHEIGGTAEMVIAESQQQETRTTSPHLSPSPTTFLRSDTASPLTLKKVTPSPTRSSSSSPLTLKKVTRRYERRSRRGEDSAHKTLEATFAEIAAQSAKAVLAAKGCEVEEEQAIDEKSQKSLNDFSVNIEPEQQVVTEPIIQLQKPTIDIEEMHVSSIVVTPVETLINVAQDNKTIVAKEDSGLAENVVNIEATKVTLAKRGRKPKNRLLELPLTISKEALEDENSLKRKKEPSIITKEVEHANDSRIEKEPVETLIEEKTKIEVHETVSTSSAELETDSKVSEIEGKAYLKPIEDIYESKTNKKSNKKRDTKAIIEDVLPVNVATCPDKEEEVRNPKEPTKKRDSSLSKSESKSESKKLTKKIKSEAEELIHLPKDETSAKVATTTPQPSKRGRKPKNQQPEIQALQPTATTSKKKNKKDTSAKNNDDDDDDDDDINVENIKLLESESDSLNATLDNSVDEKLAKKKRQKKLKEAFEAALADNAEKRKEPLQTESSLGITLSTNTPPPPENSESACNEEVNEAIKLTCLTPVEEDPDPLKDIEKFIADGVNLLKKDYKLNEDSVDDVIPSKQTSESTEIAEESVKVNSEDCKEIFNTFETPAYTPINTPRATPPPKSPTSTESSPPDEYCGVRRSHRIKLITKTPKALVGRGLVKDKERFSIKDDVETKTHYTLDDHLTDLAEVEAKNAKFLKEMEERLSNFQVIKENDYLCERVISREARKMICDCFLTQEEEERGELGCGEDCLNRLLMIECGPECNVKERCTNKRFQKLLCSPCRVFRTEKKGFGILADIEILPGEFIMEYVGEVIDTEEFEKRRVMYSQDKNRHYYFMALRSDAIIDATIKGNISRFINHSCDPNAETQKWTVNGELRIGFFSRKSIMPGEEITFNYQYQRYGREAQRCYCESTNCTGWIGQEPTSDEGEQLDDEDYESEDDDEEEGEEADTSNLLVHDDDEDSDASVADPEEVQKQLEMAAAQAAVELAPLQLLEGKDKHGEITANDDKSIHDLNKSENEEDSKSKFKKLLTKMAEKVAAKQKQNKREQKLQRKKKSKESSSRNKIRFLEDPDIEDEVEFLKECGLKNQSDTLRLSRLMVRAKLVQTRLNLLEILRKGDFPCRRLFLDYHGLRLLHGWMSEDAGNMQIRLSLLQTLDTLPIANKTVLTDSKVMQVVRNWCGNNTNLSPNDDSSSSNSNSQDVIVEGSGNFEDGSEMAELQKLALKLIGTWDGLPEIFRIPKKERIEQMKEHEREADRQYAANAETQENTTAIDRYRRDRFGRDLNATNNTSNRFVKPNSGNSHRSSSAITRPENVQNLSKAQRREMFAAKVARDEAEKRLAEKRREFETKCRFFGLDPKKTRAQDIPFCVNPATGQWYSVERKPIPTPPSYTHVQVPVKAQSTDPNDYQLPAVCSNLPAQWKYSITPQGKIYYYHMKHRISQWEPPSAAQLQQCEMELREDDSENELTATPGEDSSDDDDDILIGMDASQLKAYIDRKVETRRQKRYQRLVDERPISPRREEDRIYNQLEVRKYKENKEKIRKRKEEIRRKRAEALRQTSLNMCTLGSITTEQTNPNPNSNKSNTTNEEELGTLPIQDYLLSSDEEGDLKAEVNSPLIDKIVEGDKIVDEFDALTTKRQLKRPLPPHRDLSEPSTSSSSAALTHIAKLEYKKRKLEKKEKRKPREQDAKYRKNKEKFRCEIAGIIVHHLKPYLKDTCTKGRIQSNEDFSHLARKLTHFVMIKELKYCESVGQTLVVTESVKSKSREFIKKYMAKYGYVYVKPANDPDFKNIPFTL